MYTGDGWVKRHTVTYQRFGFLVSASVECQRRYRCVNIGRALGSLFEREGRAVLHVVESDAIKGLELPCGQDGYLRWSTWTGVDSLGA